MKSEFENETWPGPAGAVPGLPREADDDNLEGISHDERLDHDDDDELDLDDDDDDDAWEQDLDDEEWL
jgi:hypothetical protein